MPTPFLASEFAPCAPDKAFFHILPVPLEKSVSYGHGTAQGPAAILEASQQLEAWDGLSSPGDLGFYTHEAIACAGTVTTVLDRIEARTAAIAACGALPVLLGGEHTVTLGALRALKKYYGSFGIVQVDAHADLRASYEGSPYSHACVMRRAVQDLDLPLAQFAVRDFSREEANFRRERHILHYDGPQLAQGLPDMPLPASFPQQLYITFDVDGLDASIMPATGTPSPGGLFWYDALCLLQRCLHGRQAIGFDVVELAPIPSLHAADYTAARLVYAIMGMIQRERARG